MTWKTELPDTSCDLWHASIHVGPDGTVYVVQDSVLTAYTPAGAVKWSAEAGQSLYGATVGASEIYAVGSSNHYGRRSLFAFDAVTGKKTVLHQDAVAPDQLGFTTIRARSDGQVEFGPNIGTGFLFDPVSRAVKPTGRVDGLALAGGARINAVVDPNGGPVKLQKLDASGAVQWLVPHMTAEGVDEASGTVYAFDDSAGPYMAELVGLDVASGAVKWRAGHNYEVRGHYHQLVVLSDGSAVLVYDAKRANAVDTWDAMLERRSATGALIHATAIPNAFMTPTQPRAINGIVSDGSSVYVSGDHLLRAYDGAGHVTWTLEEPPYGDPASPIFPTAMTVGANHTLFGVTAPYRYQSQPQTPACSKGTLMKVH